MLKRFRFISSRSYSSAALLHARNYTGRVIAIQTGIYVSTHNEFVSTSVYLKRNLGHRTKDATLRDHSFY